jgi:hypothetical protein
MAEAVTLCYQRDLKGASWIDRSQVAPDIVGDGSKCLRQSMHVLVLRVQSLICKDSLANE